MHCRTPHNATDARPGLGWARLQVFLDALGEPQGSVRRLGSRGIYDWQVLNSGTQFAVDLLLLDERYERVPLPCHTRAAMCATGNGTFSPSLQACPPPLAACHVCRRR